MPDIDTAELRKIASAQQVYVWIDAVNAAADTIDRLRADLAAAERRGAENELRAAARDVRDDLGRVFGIVDIGDEAGRWLNARAAALGGTATEAGDEPFERHCADCYLKRPPCEPCKRPAERGHAS